MIREDSLDDPSSAKQKYTLKNLRFIIFPLFFQSINFPRELFDRVIKLSNEPQESQKSKLIESIRTLTVFLIWGDKNNDDFFEYFPF